MEQNSLINNISKRAFWDVKFDELDPTKHKEYIIRKIFERGKWQDIIEIIKFYSYDSTIKTLLNIETMNTQGLQIASTIFNKPKEDFKCFTNKPFLPSCLKH